jgi:hypothetical protein
MRQLSCRAKSPPGAGWSWKPDQKVDETVSRIRFATASALACVTLVALGPIAAAAQTVTKPKPVTKTKAKTVTKHFYSVPVYSRISDPSGDRLSANTQPTVSDRVSYADNDYTGNHTRHAKRATASDHTVCTLISSTSVLCDGAFAINGALILADDYVLSFPTRKNATTIKITGGTGVYKGARGTITATSQGKALDVTITLTT